MAVTVPIEVHNLPADLVIANQYKKDIRGPCAARAGSSRRCASSTSAGRWTWARPAPGPWSSRTTQLHPLPPGHRRAAAQPANITLLVDQLVEKEFPITAVTPRQARPATCSRRWCSTRPGSAVTGPAATGPGNGPQDPPDQPRRPAPVRPVPGAPQPERRPGQLIGETVVQANVVIREAMVRRRVEGIPVNARGYGQEGMRASSRPR